MQAHKLKVMIGKDRGVSFEVPETFAEGPAEVIVLAYEAPVTGTGATLEEILRSLASEPRRIRSKEEIDRYLEEERESWE